jgi:DNA excision repair protein ERCC-2
MPSGTGKTVTLLSLITSYQLAHPEVGKLIYCSRTVPEIEKVLEEAKRVLGYREKELGDAAPKALCLGMSARRNLCAHPRVSQFREGRVVDSLCRDLISPWNRERAKNGQHLQTSMEPPESSNNNAESSSGAIETCSFYEKFMEGGGLDVRLHGVYTIEDIREFGTKQGWCPYFLSRHSINHADIVVFSYQYVIDPKITELISKEFKSNCILVFDEAHNIGIS